MKPKIPNDESKTSPAPARPKTSPSSESEEKKIFHSVLKSKLHSALDHVERKTSTRRLNKFIAERNTALDSLQESTVTQTAGKGRRRRKTHKNKKSKSKKNLKKGKKYNTRKRK